MSTCRFVSVVLACYITLTHGRYFRSDYTYHHTIEGWLKLQPMPVTWDEARIRCFSEGSTLASPSTEELLAAMKTTAGKIPMMFTGISSTYANGVFFSVEGARFEKMHKTWAPGEPNSDGTENCIAVGVNGSLADVDCDKPLPYICYRKNSENIPSVNKCGTVDPDYSFEARTNHCYKLHRFGQHWSRAFLTCAAEGGYLAVVNSDAEAQALRELMAKYPSSKVVAKFKDYFAIGVHDWSQHGVFMTIHGQTLKDAGYEKWASGQPDNQTTGEYCGSLLRDSTLNDIWCEQSIPFICEKEPGSLLDNESGNGEEVNIDQRATQ